MYISRSGKNYYLHKSFSKTGKIKYTFSTNSENCISEIPIEYEIYEPPNANVFLRKKFDCIISEDDIIIINDALIKSSRGIVYILDKKKTGIGIFVDEKTEAIASTKNKCSIDINHYFVKIYYNPTFRIGKIEGDYIIERYCFLNGIDDWIFLEKEKNLKRLCNKYFVHINKESFFELM